MAIYFENYERENKPFLKEFLSNITSVVKLRSKYEQDLYIRAFEEEFARYNKSKFAIGVDSGTTALELALRASGVGKDDEVILPAYTYIATALAVSNIGAKPVFVDIQEDTLTINPKEIKGNITKKTKAIIPVHIHGNPCDMDKIVQIALSNNLSVIEDASHAHGAVYRGKKVGNFGIGCFSCSMSKNLAYLGSAGLITTNNKNVYETILEISSINNDPDPRLSNRTPCGMGVLEAAILKAKLPFLNKIITRKRNIAYFYKKSLPRWITCQEEEKNSQHVYRDFVILSKERAKLKKYLEDREIKTCLRYADPLHITEYYRHLSYKAGDLPVTEKVCRRALCIPIYYFLLESEVRYISDTIKTLKKSHR